MEISTQKKKAENSEPGTKEKILLIKLIGMAVE